MTKNNTGVLGIDYKEVSKIVNDSDTDWIQFIKDDKRWSYKNRTSFTSIGY